MVVRCVVVVLALLGGAGLAQAGTAKDIYKRSAPGVVLILASDGAGEGSGGTGSIISKDGKVLTNAHTDLSRAALVVGNAEPEMPHIVLGELARG